VVPDEPGVVPGVVVVFEVVLAAVASAAAMNLSIVFPVAGVLIPKAIPDPQCPFCRQYPQIALVSSVITMAQDGNVAEPAGTGTKPESNPVAPVVALTREVQGAPNDD